MDQRSIISTARTHIDKMLDRLPGVVGTAGRDAVVEFVCDEIKKLPIPIVATALAKVVEKMLSREPGGGYDIEDVVERLDKMRRSDDDFRQAMDDWHIDLGAIQQDIAAIAEAVRAQATTDLRGVNLRFEQRYPVHDNRLSVVVLNAGGGTVNAEEIHLDVERWEPLAEVDFTAPAAPMPELALRVTLEVERRDYPLLRLNGEPDRVYHAQGAGAERVTIDMKSRHNARYWVRLRIPYQDLTGGRSGVLLCPPAGEPPVEVSFTFAPAWNSDIDPEHLLARSAVLEQMIAKFRGLAAIFRDGTSLGHGDAIGERMERAGLHGWMLRALVHRFVPVLAQLASLERRQDVLPLVVDVLTYYEPPDGDRAELAAQFDVTGVARLANDPYIAPVVRSLLSEPELAQREELGRRIVAALRPLAATAPAGPAPSATPAGSPAPSGTR